eukprot:6208285-Pleurochrysis_carterae.AAC.4
MAAVRGAACDGVDGVDGGVLRAAARLAGALFALKVQTIVTHQRGQTYRTGRGQTAYRTTTYRSNLSLPSHTPSQRVLALQPSQHASHFARCSSYFNKTARLVSSNTLGCGRDNTARMYVWLYLSRPPGWKSKHRVVQQRLVVQIVPLTWPGMEPRPQNLLAAVPCILREEHRCVCR